jgi:two-component system CitB family sensor kinase
LGIQARFFLLQALVFSLLTLILAGIQVVVTRQNVQGQIGERALAISRSVALLPTIIEAMDDPQPARVINPLANRIRERVGADYIVVGDTRGIRLSHPITQRIGQPMQGGDNDEPLAGKEIISVATGSLGTAIRGKVPIWKDGRVIGVVSTGYLLPTVQSIARGVVGALLPWFGLALLLALVSSIVISRRIKREMLDLEPDQISSLVLQHRAVLSALQEGVLVVSGGEVQIVNPKAAQMLGIQNLPVSLRQVWPELAGSGLLHHPGSENEALRLGQTPVLVTVLEADAQQVVTFRDQAELMGVAEELTHTRKYTELLRAQTHEFKNRLHTISGLIQLGQPEEALKVIGRESEQIDLLKGFIAQIEVPALAALVVGKVQRARELGIELVLEPTSALSSAWTPIAEALVLLCGNLLENAYEAVLTNSNPTRRVWLSIGEDPEGLQIEVKDNGPGVAPELARRIYERGFSTRGEGRGLGLSLVRQQLEALGGSIVHIKRGGLTVFQGSIPGRG